MICLSLTSSTLNDNRDLVLKHREFIDLAELRVDALAPHEWDHVGELPRRLEASGVRLPLILTVRRTTDGGLYSGDEHNRIALLQETTGFEFVDLEEDLRDTVAGIHTNSILNRRGVRIIRSLHDTECLPESPAESIRDLASEPGEIAKIAVSLRSTRDLAGLLAASDETTDCTKIVIGMGAYGLASRVLYKRFGSMLTFVSDPDSRQAAPGHLSPEAMARLYRASTMDQSTRFFAVIGSPILHSRSPQYHNARFESDEINACYIPILVDDIAPLMQVADALPLEGMSVTIPLKEDAAAVAQERDVPSRIAGSCNTLIRGNQGWQAINTDVPGIVTPLKQVLIDTIAGKGATVIGAGGAARAAAYALLQMDMDVLVLNRHAGRAEQLVAELRDLLGLPADRVESGGLDPESASISHRSVVVQCTSVGMHGTGDPVPWLSFDGHEIVFDVVYTPPVTPLIKRAKQAGCITITGDRMFEAQANAQYELFSQRAVS